MDSKALEIYRRLLQYSRPYAWRIAFAVVASVLVAGTDVMFAQLVQPLVDNIIAAKNADIVYYVPVAILSLAVVKGASRYFQEYMIKTAGQLVIQDVRNDLYSRSVGQSMGFFGRHQTGSLMSRVLNDVGMMQRSAADVVVDVVRDSFALIGLVALVFYRDVNLALVSFTVLPLVIFPAIYIGRKVKINTVKGQKQMGGVSSVLQETFAGIKVIKAFGSESRESGRFRDENFRYYRFIRKVLKYDAATAPIVEIFASIGAAAVFWYGINRVIDGAMTQGELFSFVTAMFMMYGPLKRLTKVNNTIQKSLGAAERVFEIMDEPVAVKDFPGAQPLEITSGEVVFDHVDFSYDGQEYVLHDFNLRAAPGEIVALVGPSGAGKSTVVGLLTRFYDPQKGAVRIDGQDICQVTLKSLKKHIALVDQETFLFNDTIYNNIRYGRWDASEEEVQKAARKAFAEDFILHLPEKYQTHIGDRGVRLSGGQRQRISIARAILRDAPILLLDEATSALDTESENEVQSALANLMRDRTTFVIAHRLSTIMDADKIVVIDNGCVLEVGTHNELLARNGLYTKLYQMQFRE
ncbi:lipid A export permease/ATP-binding protein MsbA [Geoalkalibacter subterraneus]|uniref:ABC transporter permease n=1 Tax=Geoalkalibacter subterraneus TaxID=483547 RepID=A0A0B5FFG2_9BACT|nr:lipid A export permease/ATP-binding protein MsbA [Geoalkalibacter subterraneus]AJF06887.1 ABC transporter permease [Geoalkalibacter subterraneus]